MKITVVGYWGAFPEKDEATSGYLLQSGDHNILIDCGSGVLSKVQNYLPLSKIDAVILSHYHGDHAADIKALQYSAQIDIKNGTRQNELQIYSHDLSDDYKSLTLEGISKWHKIDDATEIQIGDLNVSFKWGKHPVPSLAMRFEENGKLFVYSGDTEWCNGILDISKDADLFICETNFLNKDTGRGKGHLTSGEVGKIANMNNVGKLVLSHLPHNTDLNELLNEAKEEFSGQIYKAYSGEVFEL
ncbi:MULTISPECIES: MBL fold metallo-hydrolase [Clostridium]|uniref:Metallo-beta-lactamase superfamily protein n=1 Tax=Clostridium novyi (strain NT) TaxID=386415 RepID=A0Q3S0_CLONN|nr:MULTISPECIES: MBL fold metallo-hydrolase [Clostridium]ABK60946.1 Metallo-beta-lactamase superfamily protein [Clostridium novyi NT]KEH85284.1 metallo-beta-lactamase [Clostridium novyi A str. NCTC 538]KEH86039.1 metallo-beta-lactamase [Clostridium novyi A str. 4540]KEH92124.1 metallo-beta-lactamase [Clostridium botulinum C/D str. It1]